MTRENWKDEYARLAMKSRFKLSEANAREEADTSWDYWSSQCPAGNPMPAPSDIIAEDMFEWVRR